MTAPPAAGSSVSRSCQRHRLVLPSVGAVGIVCWGFRDFKAIRAGLHIRRHRLHAGQVHDIVLATAVLRRRVSAPHTHTHRARAQADETLHPVRQARLRSTHATPTAIEEAKRRHAKIEEANARKAIEVMTTICDVQEANNNNKNNNSDNNNKNNDKNNENKTNKKNKHNTRTETTTRPRTRTTTAASQRLCLFERAPVPSPNGANCAKRHMRPSAHASVLTRVRNRCAPHWRETDPGGDGKGVPEERTEATRRPLAPSNAAWAYDHGTRREASPALTARSGATGKDRHPWSRYHKDTGDAPTPHPHESSKATETQGVLWPTPSIGVSIGGEPDAARTEASTREPREARPGARPRGSRPTGRPAVAELMLASVSAQSAATAATTSAFRRQGSRPPRHHPDHRSKARGRFP